MNLLRFSDGVVCCANLLDSELLAWLAVEVGTCALIVADPPYGNVLRAKWDRFEQETPMVTWMLEWVRAYSELLAPQGAFYVWGGVGKPRMRPFYRLLAEAEHSTTLTLANHITWAKKRAYGVQNNYLFTREELAYFCKGDPKRPRVFNIPLLDAVRPYAGYNAKYPAKSVHYRRTNVWSDVTEIFARKVHVAQKAMRVCEIPIEVHTNPGETVIDLFSGSGQTSIAARNLGRRFVAIESDPDTYRALVDRLSE